MSLAQARRIALAAQGFGAGRPALPGRGHVNRAVAGLGLLQIDSVNVLARAHYLPLFARLGAYRQDLLEDGAWGPRRSRAFFEYWAHEASLLPLALHPLLRWRMERARDGHGLYAGLARLGRERRPFIDAVLNRIEAEGALAASDFEGMRGSGGWWGWSEAKAALEWLFWAGFVTTSTRRASFERVYDLPERVLPPAVLRLPTPGREEAQRALLAHAARALGIATASDLRDYFRLSPADTAPRLAELVEAGEILPVTVEGWTHPAYLHARARLPRRIEARALLAPFDPVVWERSRALRLFGFHYRLEIYTPAERRQFGYYVLPFLLGDTLVARLDLKADRAGGCLKVQAAHGEAEAPPETAAALAAELRLLADWLGLADVAAGPGGNLAAALKSQLG